MDKMCRMRFDYSRYSRDENLIDEIYKKKYRDLSSNGEWRTLR